MTNRISNKWLNVESSNIKGVFYVQKDRTLKVRFNRGTTYIYTGIDLSTYKALLEAKSKGKFFHAAIKQHPYLKLTDEG